MFNQRNYSASLGFYQPNDFSNTLEYFMNKYILKYLSKCRENRLRLKEQFREEQQQQ